ncbi:vesicle-fusing ATPase [Tribonema minus]|uniref:Vesicle-fusing ATPase n=1 Tax=Tribonema minus TaxID=303371 RepID=A0A836CBN6_9STRA|nr:vesicle-fusing ATPase [Tribonema minus]
MGRHAVTAAAAAIGAVVTCKAFGLQSLPSHDHVLSSRQRSMSAPQQLRHIKTSRTALCRWCAPPGGTPAVAEKHDSGDSDLQEEHEQLHQQQQLQLNVFHQLLQDCQTAADYAATAEPADAGSGSSEWSGFWTAEPKLQQVLDSLQQCSPAWRGGRGASLAWSWLGLSTMPLRVMLHQGGGFGVLLTVLPPGAKPPAHRPMIGAHMLSIVCQGDVEQVKANGQRIINRTRHTPETPIWNSFGGGVRRLANMSVTTAYILEVLFYGKRGPPEYDTRAPDGGAAERNAEADEFILSGPRAMATLSAPPCDPEVLFRSVGEEGGDEGGEVLVIRGREGSLLLGGQGGGAAAAPVTSAAAVVGASLATSVGGLDTQLEEIVRRVLATRALPADVRQALGVSHVRGLLLYGPPGCGKTLLARELARRLKARPPQLVSGPEVLDKWVGEAERKVRALFAAAEEEHERCVRGGGDPADLPLHVICFDELDALCRTRGSLLGDTSGVRDSVVNQILAKMDGLVGLQNLVSGGTKWVTCRNGFCCHAVVVLVTRYSAFGASVVLAKMDGLVMSLQNPLAVGMTERRDLLDAAPLTDYSFAHQYNQSDQHDAHFNTISMRALVVGMTNRRDLLDAALLRPGRLEVAVFVPLPDEQGRRQILAIHLRQARSSGLVDDDVSDALLASRTAGFSGADLAGLVRSAISFAVARWQDLHFTRAAGGVAIATSTSDSTANESADSAATAGVRVTVADFERALLEVEPSVSDSGERLGVRRRLRNMSKAVAKGLQGS